jgi:L-threonylcarbamoyladenylate synthase
MRPDVPKEATMTEVLPIDASAPEPERIERAAAVLRGGGLVAFPTETVYGLGARAGDGTACARIFEAKGRPATSALIVHVDSAAQARGYAAEWPEAAERLAAAFWPGPLSIVLPRSARVPDVVSAGGLTVAMRAPANAVALALIAAAGEGLAAPSANRSSRLPPVRAAHVLKGLDGRIDLVLDAGPCEGGLESTVVDLCSGRARVLRRGAVTVERLAQVVDVQDAGRAVLPEGKWLRVASAQELERGAGEHDGVLLREARAGAGVRRVLGSDPAAFAASMYDALHELEDAGCELVWVEQLPGEPAWDAIRDRLARL